MRKHIALLFTSIWLISIVSCSGDSSDNAVPSLPLPETPHIVPKTSTLTIPSIITPQADAICQGSKQSNGKFKIKVKSTKHHGADNYLFKLWNSKGALVKKIKNKTNEALFNDIERGSTYTLAVIISNNTNTRESSKISFCTPGIQVINYIPVVKSATYSRPKASLFIDFYDPDTADTSLFYSIKTSKTKEFKQIKTLKNNIKVVKNKILTIPEINLKKGTYVKIIVRDNIGSQSAYIFQIEK